MSWEMKLGIAVLTIFCAMLLSIAVVAVREFNQLEGPVDEEEE